MNKRHEGMQSSEQLENLEPWQDQTERGRKKKRMGIIIN